MKMTSTATVPTTKWMQWIEHRLDTMEQDIEQMISDCYDCAEAFDPIISQDELTLTFGTEGACEIHKALDKADKEDKQLARDAANRLTGERVIPLRPLKKD